MNAAATTGSSIRAAFSYCAQQVHRYDYHHYLCLLHLPPPMRKAAFAFRAFNVEIARAMDSASEPRVGLMRLFWWQETLDKIFSKKLIEQPVAAALSTVISEHKIGKHWLKRMVEARINDASRDENCNPGNIGELERYAEDTVSTILYMTLQAGGIQSTAADHAASHVGKASGLLLLMKSLPHHVTRTTGRIPYIPVDVAEKHGLPIIAKDGTWEMQNEAVSDAVFEVASTAAMHLRKARELGPTIPEAAIPILLPAVAAQVLFDSMKRRNFDVFDSKLGSGVLGISPLWYQLKLKWHAWRNNY